MSQTYISAELRRLAVVRADGLCEYCLIHEDDTFFGCEIDHIISEKHGGLTVAENLVERIDAEIDRYPPLQLVRYRRPLLTKTTVGHLHAFQLGLAYRANLEDTALRDFLRPPGPRPLLRARHWAWLRWLS